MLIMSGIVLALMLAARTRDGIRRVYRALAVRQIPEQKNGGGTVPASDDNIPSPRLGLDGHGLLRSGAYKRIGAGVEPRVVGSVFQA